MWVRFTRTIRRRWIDKSEKKQHLQEIRRRMGENRSDERQVYSASSTQHRLDLMLFSSDDCRCTQELPHASQPEGSNSGVWNDQNAVNNRTASEVQSTQVPLSRSKRPLEIHNPPEPNAKRSKQSPNLPPLLTFHVDRLLELVNGREDLSEAIKLLKDSLKVMKIIGNIRLTLWHLDYLKKMCPNDATILEAVDFVGECLEVRDELELE
ncbi:hypothetical protein JVU11DRAFT_10876 [Chiua virens]|nr:hypothetical protein JVU11DRAFT_10876 [Chiua virens]